MVRNGRHFAREGTWTLRPLGVTNVATETTDEAQPLLFPGY